MKTMRRYVIQGMGSLLTMLLLVWTAGSAGAQGGDERYNLAVYATGSQNDQPLSTSLQTVVQNKTITKLTGEGNYRLIERSNEFLRQIQNEQTMQQSGDVADGQIAEIGAGYGAQKVCVVSITIIDKYLYIATRIVDVATKTSYESGDAEITEYTSIPVLTKALETALDRMIAKGNQQAASTQTKPAETTPNTVAKTRADFESYKLRLKEEKGGFLDMKSMAYKEYQKYKRNLISGSILVSLGYSLTIVSSIAWNGGVNPKEYYSFHGHYPTGYWLPYAGVGLGSTIAIIGIIQLSTMNKHLRKSYQYYLNGNQRTVSWQVAPYYGGNNTFGAGLSLRF